MLDIPGVGEAVADALDLSEARMHSHTGRATRTVLENLPRDLVLEQEPTSVARLVAAIVGLQERQLVRVFEVPEPVGPWSTVLVYLPRNRFTAELPERIADAVAQAYGAERRTFEPYLGSSSLARIAVSVRRPGGAGASTVDLEALERHVDELSTSWSDRLRSALVGPGRRGGGASTCSSASGPTRRRRTAPRCRRSAPTTTSGASPRCSPATTS